MNLWFKNRISHVCVYVCSIYRRPVNKWESCYCRKVEDQTHSNVIIHELDLSCPGSLLLLNSANGNFKWVPRGEFIRPFPSPHSIRPFEFRINDFCRVMTNVRINSEPFNLQDSINHVMMQMAKVRKDSLRIPRMKSYSPSSLPFWPDQWKST